MAWEETYKLELSDVNHFLESKGIKCLFCGGQFIGILAANTLLLGPDADASNVMISGFVGRNADFTSKFSLLETSYFQLPVVYTVPVRCVECGNVQHFSLGNVVASKQDYGG